MNYGTVYALLYLVAFALLCYELIAFITQVTKINRQPTISEAIWRMTKRHPWLKWAGTIFGTLLILHFWWGLW